MLLFSLLLYNTTDISEIIRISTYFYHIHQYSTTSTTIFRYIQYSELVLVPRNLMEHGLPLMLHTAELGNGLHEPLGVISNGKDQNS
jgi:hypothetical protein